MKEMRLFLFLFLILSCFLVNSTSLTKTVVNKNKNKKIETLKFSPSSKNENEKYSTNDANPKKDTEFLSSVALVAGTTVGAGILALPDVSKSVGFVYSSGVIFSSWVYMLLTSLLIAEVNLNLVKQSKSGNEQGILAMTQNVLGNKAAIASGALYCFIHYALLTAYISEGGGILNSLFNLNNAKFGPLLFITIFGGIMASEKNSLIEAVNFIFTSIVLLSFVLLVFSGATSINLENLIHLPTFNIKNIINLVPVTLVSLVFHNIVPNIVARAQYDRKKIVKTLVVGSAIPMAMFIVWNGVILGMGSSIDSANSSIIKLLLNLFSEAAIVTSFIGFVIGLRSFFVDLLKEKNDVISNASKDKKVIQSRTPSLLYYLLILVVPTILALFNPDIFVPALDYAGKFGISLLFCAIPAVLALKSRNIAGDSYVYLVQDKANIIALTVLVLAIATVFI